MNSMIFMFVTKLKKFKIKRIIGFELNEILYKYIIDDSLSKYGGRFLNFGIAFE